jgi:hypothetical protein
MLRAHSLLWHYLWVAPNVLLLALSLLLWKRGLAKQFPAFLAFAVLSAISELVVYAADIIPSVDPWTFWRVDWVSVLIVGLLKFALIGEVFALVFGSYASLASLGKRLIRGVGVALVFAATVLAAYAPRDGRFGIISGAHLLEQAIQLIEVGLLVFICVFSYYFRLSWGKALFGIIMGLGISSCFHVAVLAFTNSGLLDSGRILLVFLSMATYHVCVLIWFYYLLLPQKTAVSAAVPLPENNLEVWNRELERLVQP